MKSTDVRNANAALDELAGLRQQLAEIEDGATAHLSFESECGDCVASTYDLDDDLVAELRAALARHLRGRITESEAMIAALGVEIVPETADASEDDGTCSERASGTT